MESPGFLPTPSESRLLTLASGLAWHSVEARAAGAVGGFLGAHAACLIPADAGVGGAAGQLGVCGGQSGPSLLSHLGLGLGSLALCRPPAASSLARRAHRCCSPPHQSRPRSHRTCCSAARRTGSAGSGTETPSCLCSGGSGPWGALGKVGASDLDIHHPGASSHSPPSSPSPLPPPQLCPGLFVKLQGMLHLKT